MKKFVIYSRQSKVSGLKGQMTLETADFTIKHYLSSVGVEDVDYEVVARFQEIRSSYGNNSRNRIEFNKAIDFCRNNPDYTLVVPNIQRFSRNTAHGATILEEIDVVLANNPHANKTMKNLLLVMGEDESYQQSERRKATYKAKRARCEKEGLVCTWGGNSDKWRISFNKNKSLGLHSHKSNATSFRVSDNTNEIVQQISRLVKITTPSNYKELTEKVTLANITTPRGKPFSVTNLANFCKRNNIQLS